jgi:GT2 family glycosyltransferase
MATAIIIVSYKTPDDIADCLGAIDKLEGGNEFGVFIVENGGADAYESILKATSSLCGDVAGEFDTANDVTTSGSRHLRCRTFELPLSGARVTVAEANDNLGYAGGVNSWLERLFGNMHWDGYWILNPDTTPEPMALAALVAACAKAGQGMAGSVILDYRQRDRITSRGLLWRRWRSSALGVDFGRTLSHPIPEPLSEIDAPSGSSFYVTRSCLKAIGFMNEDYFLYFEDLEWGMRAKAAGLLCRADGSLVPHKYGSALGSASRRADRSPLSVYLDARNTLLFIKFNDPSFLVWAVVLSLVKTLEYIAVGSPQNAGAAFSGLVAGLKGESGRPKWHT